MPGPAFTRLRSAEVYDPSTNTWTAIAPMRTARYGVAATTLNGRVYALGGSDTATDPYNNPTVSSTVPSKLRTVEAYDPSTNTWTSSAPMGIGRNGLAATTINGTMYELGGALSTWPARWGVVHSAEAYDPSTNTWTAIAPIGLNYNYCNCGTGYNGCARNPGDGSILDPRVLNNSGRAGLAAVSLFVPPAPCPPTPSWAPMPMPEPAPGLHCCGFAGCSLSL
eukprot:COSAG01_NODE_26802_length_703_cov_0.554636_1_plen_223_part_00